MLRRRRVDGIIVLTGRLSDDALRDLAHQMPVVVTGRTMEAAGLYALDFNSFEGARLATHHLLSLGHREIAFISGPQVHPDAMSVCGLQISLGCSGYQVKPAASPGTYQEESGRMAVERLLDSRLKFSAIFCGQRPDGLWCRAGAAPPGSARARRCVFGGLSMTSPLQAIRCRR